MRSDGVVSIHGRREASLQALWSLFVAQGEFADWINEDEKYALVGLSVNFHDDIPRGEVARGLYVLAGTTFHIPDDWQEWLGTIRTEELQNCNLYLLCKNASQSPGVLDAENQELQKQVHQFYVGLMLASTFAPSDKPVILTGSRRNGEIEVREHGALDGPIPCAFRPYPAILPDEIALATQLGISLEALAKVQIDGGKWRIFRTLSVYVAARTTADILDRLHQYCRVVDGLILPRAGETRRQFMSRSELFIGPQHHELMGELYDIRSAIEHLHENRYLEVFDRELRLDLIKKEAIIEHIARTALCRVVGNSDLWPHFSNVEVLKNFWALAPENRQAIWGDPVDPLEAIEDFNPDYIHDGALGGK